MANPSKSKDIVKVKEPEKMQDEEDKDIAIEEDKDKDEKFRLELCALDGDDEFEDFPVEDTGSVDDKDGGGAITIWEDDWDDDNIEEDFSVQLKRNTFDREAMQH